MSVDLARKAVAEALGTAMLLAIIVGSATALFRWLVPSLPIVATSAVDRGGPAPAPTTEGFS